MTKKLADRMSEISAELTIRWHETLVNGVTSGVSHSQIASEIERLIPLVEMSDRMYAEFQREMRKRERFGKNN